MNPNEILGFLLPQWSDPLQLTFFLIILGMITATIVSAHRTARASAWEHKWNRGTPDDPSDDLEIGHGSVTDLWQAVATAPEKLAEIMPGMLLVVGLLGTFLGLGLALNHASSILGHANLADPGAAADSMQNLLGLLQGLGTKFKTSTWGILGFVSLKIWSEITRFDEKRLAWVIGKVKNELELRKRTEAEEQQAREHALFQQIGGTAQQIVAGFGQQIAALIKSNEALHLQQLAHLAKIEKGMDGVRTELGGVQTATETMCESMTSFTKSTRKVVDQMGEAAQGMVAGADKVGDGATQLVQAVNAFENKFTGVLDHVRKDLSEAINNLSTQASVTLKEGSAQLNEATTQISTALRVLSTDVKETMSAVDTSIKGALEIQKTTSKRFIESSDSLNTSIEETTGMIGKLAEPIHSGLLAVSGANLKIGGVAKAVESSTASLAEVVKHLKDFPKALLPLKDMPADQRALLEMLKPLSETVKVQQAMLKLLEEIQRDRANAQCAVVATTVAPITSAVSTSIETN